MTSREQQHAPVGAPQGEDSWTHFDKSGNAVYFGFVATAILIFIFLVMATFDKFLRPHSLFARTSNGAGLTAAPKIHQPSHNVAMEAKEVSVLMPGNNVPTFIANPAPMLSLSSTDRASAFTRADIQLNNTNV